MDDTTTRSQECDKTRKKAKKAKKARAISLSLSGGFGGRRI